MLLKSFWFRDGGCEGARIKTDEVTAMERHRCLLPVLSAATDVPTLKQVLTGLGDRLHAAGKTAICGYLSACGVNIAESEMADALRQAFGEAPAVGVAPSAPHP